MIVEQGLFEPRRAVQGQEMRTRTVNDSECDRRGTEGCEQRRMHPQANKPRYSRARAQKSDRYAIGSAYSGVCCEVCQVTETIQGSYGRMGSAVQHQLPERLSRSPAAQDPRFAMSREIPQVAPGNRARRSSRSRMKQLLQHVRLGFRQ